MISFRFHLVSLVAVFLALGLGVLTGTTVLNKGIVTQLERQTDQLVETSGRLRAQVRELQAESEAWARFGEEATEYLVSDRLVGAEVVLVTQEGTDGAVILRVRRGLEAAGAELRAVLSIDDRMALETEADVQELAVVLGENERDPEALSVEAALVLADRLAFGARGVDVLERLLDAGFVLNRGPGGGAEALREPGGETQVVVVVAGGPGRPEVDPERFLVPFVRRLAESGAMVGAAESLESEYPFTTLLRGTVSGPIATQDNVDQIPGEVGLVLALEDLVLDGRPGHYGVKQGATRLIPPLS